MGCKVPIQPLTSIRRGEISQEIENHVALKALPRAWKAQEEILVELDPIRTHFPRNEAGQMNVISDVGK